MIDIEAAAQAFQPKGAVERLVKDVVLEMEGRDETAFMEARPVPVVLGTTEYSVRPQPFLRAQAWRRKAAGLLHAAREMGGASLFDEEHALGLNPDGLVKLAEFLMVGLLEHVLELALAWDPEIEAQADAVKTQAYDLQILRLFLVELCFAYPFMPGWLAAFMQPAPTSPNPEAAPTRRKRRRNRNRTNPIL